ncbi:hypothetical protein GCM10025791_05720 [Halioxenophilus aromaticivorans]|uniref:Uncharacterized protein n=1 Tax=Halioxenophilus aromaticivorans TaxID=1306992 RepID=A0AAV3TY82_9ALTE
MRKDRKKHSGRNEQGTYDRCLEIDALLHEDGLLSGWNQSNFNSAVLLLAFVGAIGGNGLRLTKTNGF